MAVTHVLTRRTAVAAPAVLLATLAFWPATAQPQSISEDERLDRLTGVWRLTASDDDARRVINEAVEDTANAMPWIARGIVRTRLRAGTPVHHRVEIAREGQRVTVRFANETYTTTLGATEEHRAPNGNAMRVTTTARPNGALELRFAQEGGSRTYVYTPLRNGGLRVATRTDSPHLPRSMFFTLDYRRDGSRAASAASSRTSGK